MKKLFLFILIIFNLQAITGFNPNVYSEMEKIINVQSKELNDYINKSRLKELQIAFYTSGTFIEQKQNLLKFIETNISKNPKVKIITYAEASDKNNKSAYIVKFDLAEATYKNHTGLKQEFQGISTLDLIQSSTDLSTFTTYKPLNISIKFDSLIIILINIGLLIAGVFLSFVTNKYYTYEIMGLSTFIVIIFSIYFYIFI